MITNTNMVVLQGNIIRDPELKEDIGLLQLSVAVDYAGNEKDSDNRTGYFDVKMWLNDNDRVAPFTVSSTREAVSSGRLGRGAKVALVGKLMHERWPREGEGGGTNSKVVIIAESINVIWSGNETSDKPAGKVAEPAEAFSLSDF